MKKLIMLSLVVSTAALAAPDPKGAPAPDAKKAPASGAPAVAPVPQPAPAKPAQEITDMAKAMAGTWKCTGKADMGGTSFDIKGTVTHKADLDGFWLRSTINGSAGKMTMHTEMLTTYDAAAKKFYRQSANGHGGHATTWGTTEGTKTSWEGDAHNMGKDIKIRGSEEMVSPKETHVVGEYSDDGGKTWKSDHDVTCKK